MFRGFAFAFFLLLAISIYPKRKDNEATGALFRILIGMSLVCLLFMIFLVEGMHENEFVVKTGLVVDMCMVPLVGWQLLKIVYPGWFGRLRLFLFFAPFAALFLVNTLNGGRPIFVVMFIYTILFALVCIFFILRGTVRQGRSAKSNYSGLTNKGVEWVCKVIYIFIAWFVGWSLLINVNPLWAVTLYYIFTIAVWIEIYRRTLRHIGVVQDKIIASGREKNAYEYYRCSDPANGKLTVDIKAYMECERPWLIPTLTLRELASMLNTNRTYLSEYLNHTLGLTFYDYLNSYRIDHACKVLASDPSKTLFQVADESGFNSLSTFRRTFEKHKGVSPTIYRRQSAD